MKKIIIILTLFMFIGVISILFVVYGDTEEFATTELSTIKDVGFDDQEKFTFFWREYIQVHGPQQTYQVFLDLYKERGPDYQHTFAHLFGGLLFELDDLSLVSVCSNAFSGGCYHDFMGKAVYEEGESVIPMLFRECDGDFLCEHGIGHGIMNYSGYEISDLMDALRICDSMSPEGYSRRCASGLFMEFNMGTMLTPFNERREFKGIYYQPCEDLPVKHRPECYVWQVGWWVEEVLSGEDQDKYIEVANLCADLSNDEEQDGCYNGMGRHAILVALEDAEKIKNLCLSIHTVEGQEICISEAARIYSLVFDDIVPAQHLCSTLALPGKDVCQSNLRQI